LQNTIDIPLLNPDEYRYISGRDFLKLNKMKSIDSKAEVNQKPTIVKIVYNIVFNPESAPTY
jgi:hypothetical protein